MERNHGSLALCRLLEVHQRNMGSYMAALRKASERAVPERGGEDTRETVADLKGRIVEEVNKILDLLSPG